MLQQTCICDGCKGISSSTAVGESWSFSSLASMHIGSCSAQAMVCNCIVFAASTKAVGTCCSKIGCFQTVACVSFEDKLKLLPTWHTGKQNSDTELISTGLTHTFWRPQ